MNLSYSILFEIFQLNIEELDNYILINKYFSMKYNVYKTKIVKIQKFYRKHPLLNFNDISKLNKFNFSQNRAKHQLVRIYIAKYPMEYLINYPTFLANKMNKNKLKIILKKDAKELDKKMRQSRRYIKNFLMNPLISIDDIIFTGW